MGSTTIGDAEGRVAPRLVEAHVAKEQAAPLYRQLRGEVVKMLHADWIHGDLSEFNILMGVNGPVIIDFPQVVTAAKNSRSEHFFRRDLGNLLRFFSSIDPAIEAAHDRDADEIWRAYVRRSLGPDFEPGRPRTGAPLQRGQPPPRRGGPGGGLPRTSGGQPQGQRPPGQGGPKRSGPEVIIKGHGGGQGQPHGAHRRRPRRRF